VIKVHVQTDIKNLANATTFLDELSQLLIAGNQRQTGCGLSERAGSAIATPGEDRDGTVGFVLFALPLSMQRMAIGLVLLGLV